MTIAYEQTRLNSFLRARRHALVCNKPAPDFFEGALLGNGGLGVVVCTRPDAVVLYFGHNNVWDIRLSEANRDRIGTFEDIFAKVRAVPDSEDSLGQWFTDYCRMARENYAKPYPRPFPCGAVLFGLDRRRTEVLGHRVDIATGACEVRLLVDGNPARLKVFVETDADRVWVRAESSLFERVHILPDPQTPAELPAFTVPESMPERTLSFRQTLSFREKADSSHPNDRAVRLTVRLNADLEARTRTATHSGRPETMGALERAIDPHENLLACIQLDEGFATAISETAGDPPAPTIDALEKARDDAHRSWRKFWNCSGVALDDPVLERTWYQNLYFLNCATKPGVTCPGLFGNWSHGKIGTAWHGDYHLDYNAQQPFWVTFSSNHVEKHLAYVSMIEHLLKSARAWARDYYRMRGACFPVSSFPVEMTMSPYPLPTWGWQICCTPWAVQSLWWHYLYTQDTQFLGRAMGTIREAVQFLVDYMKRPDAHGTQWGDDRYHLFPTVPTELYGLQPGLKRNRDCLPDLALIRFVFRAFCQAHTILESASDGDDSDAELVENVRDILDHFPDYPTADIAQGMAFMAAPASDPEIIHNAPANLMSVFPGEHHGLHSSPEDYAIAANTYRLHRNEGGTELVFFNLQGARLGLLDLERFKRQIEYCRMPNGVCTNRVLESQGRYKDSTDFDFMSRMGIWFENFALPAVINECLLQGYNGTLRLFPNWPKERDAEFRTLRAAGAFLVSAAISGGEVQWIEILSEAGGSLRVQLPWSSGATCTDALGTRTVPPGIFAADTARGETLRLTPA